MTLDRLIAKWLGKEGFGERAEYQVFLTEFAQALGVPVPGDAGFARDDYRFEAPVRSEAVFGSKATKRIDLYKRDCFVLEAKQSQLRPGETAPAEPAAPPPVPVLDLFGNPVGFAAPAKPTPRYDRLMADARLQAERYALALPDRHRAPPFLIVADIGRSFELYFDWSGTGRGYGPFPDERHYRIALADLADPRPLAGLEESAAALLRAIWVDPASVDPRLKAAKVTRDIARLLSEVAARLEKEERQRNPGAVEVALGIEQTSLFLMRVLFCMFAEDVELLPADSFKRFLASTLDRSDQYWRSGLTDLWSRMNDREAVNRYWSHGDAIVRYFNGNLFSATRVYDLPPDDRAKLLAAAKMDWRSVEPAIFGTLLEQVLTTADRAKLGAHYTPRAYVERLVQATILDVLRPEWAAVRAQAMSLLNPPRDGEGDHRAAMVEGAGVVPLRASVEDVQAAPATAPATASAIGDAIALATAFHARLVAVRVLDPACGTGNFLYVAMEQLLRLESEVRQFVVGLGGRLAPAVHPNQFLGLELNPRAGVIAELVLWIGWLRYRLANTPEAIGEPVLPPLSNINEGSHGGYDAVLVRDPIGEPDTAAPRRPVWPDADFIVGNPPFIGGQDLRERLGGDYAQALWRANPRVPKSADFVMHWWDRAADILTRPGTRLRRFGFVTTNSITQVFSRRVIEAWLAEKEEGSGAPGRARGDDDANVDGQTSSVTPASSRGPASSSPLAVAKLHLVLAIPDHPWTRVTKDAAAVRIAMTVAAAGPGEGRLVRITGERAIDTDAPELDEAQSVGVINANLTTGANSTRAVKLKANAGISHDGVKLHGKGFAVSDADLPGLGLGRREGLDAFIRAYRNGRDLTGRTEEEVAGKYVIDLFGLDEHEVMTRFPEVYQHLLRTVKPERDANRRESYKRNWWIFGEPRRDARPALSGLSRYIATVDTAKHRLFQFLPAQTLCDDGVVVIADDRFATLGVLSSAVHKAWAVEAGGWLGVGNDSRYLKSLVFDPFPFPDHSDAVAAVAERLDRTRRTALAENPALTMTGLYNLVEEVRAGALPPAREAAVVKARARIVAKLHDDLDAAVAAAYGWGEDWAKGPLPPAEIVARLVRLNAARAAEEARGHIRWLRPAYQEPRFGG